MNINTQVKSQPELPLGKPVKVKGFTWSYSKLKNYETCPRRYYETEVNKSVEEQRSQELDRGDALHLAMYNRVVGSTALPPEFIYMESWAEKLTRVLHPNQIIQGELKLSTDINGRPTGYMHPTTWVRTKIDYLRQMPTEYGANMDIGHIVDYKTGKPPRVWDATQLALNAWVVFKHYKNIAQLRVDYLWTEYDDTTHADYSRNDIAQEMAYIKLRVIKLEDAHKSGVFEPRPCGLCAEYCPVSSCEHWGKRQRK